jgi:hypothetical protein
LFLCPEECGVAGGGPFPLPLIGSADGPGKPIPAPAAP